MHSRNWCALSGAACWTSLWTSAGARPRSGGTSPWSSRGTTNNYYAPGSEGGIAWDDPALGIDWRLAPGDVVLSPKDSGHPRLAEAAELFDYNTDYYA